MTVDQIATIAQDIIEHDGYCLVPSATWAGEYYRVTVDEHGHSTGCNCKAGGFGRDCGHRVAVDHFKQAKREVVETCAICGHPLHHSSVVCGYCVGY